MSDNFYGGAAATEPGLSAQMDPLGTANQNAFGQAAPSAEPAVGFGAAPGNPSIGAAPAASVKIGKTTTKTKKPLSTGKKVLYGACAILFTFFGLIIVLDPGPQTINPSPTPPVAAPVAAEQMGAPGASGGAATVMGGAPAAADGAQGAQAAFVETPATPAPATAQAAPDAAPAPAQPAQAPAAAAAATAAPAAAVAAQPAPVAVAAAPAPASPATPPTAAKPTSALAEKPAEKLVMVNEKAPAAAASPDELASRVATLEKRLARYEREEARQRAQAAKAAAQIRTVTRAPAPAPASAPVATATYRPVAAAPVAEMRKPAMLSNDSVRVIGVSTRHGVTTALVDFGGVKQRVAAGETIPGLGTVGSVAVDAAGNPVVEVNGVRYQ